MKVIEMAVAYLSTLIGFTFEQKGEHCLRIYSVHIRGYVDFWPTTGKYQFSDARDCTNASFSALNISLSELVNGISK